MKRTHRSAPFFLAGAFALAAAGGLSAQTLEDLKKDHETPGDVLVYGMGLQGQRYSPLKSITKDNVKRLVPKWSYSMNDTRGAEAFPLVSNGMVYTTSHSATVAVDAVTGKQVWKTVHDYPPEVLRIVCCGIVNRGAAIYNGKVIRVTLDNHIVAMDAKTGKVVYDVVSPEISADTGYSMTGAPLISNGVLITGVAGAEYGIRGFIEGYDAETGKHLWRLYTIPKEGEPGHETWAGDSAKVGGGSSWVTGTYDADLDLVYWGVGNPSPWNPRGRKGDNLFTNAIFAIRPKTGERVWYYQTSPEDPFDYDAVQTPVIATINVEGKPRKVVMQANRNGFLYVLDAADGKLLAANAFDKVNWADGVDLKTGRPKVNDVFKGALAGENVTVWPSVSGSTNWQHMAFSPLTGALYINVIHVGMTYQAGDPPKNLTMGRPSGPGSVKRTTVLDDPNVLGYLKAVDPLTGKSKWETPYKSPNFSSTMVTASNLVFTGVMTGEFQALDADTGKVLWSFQTPSGIIGQPITWERDGKQYVTVMSGIGGVYALRSGDPNLANVPAGASLWTFGLFED
ncbi:MAG: quinoprotein ethanol dehydrogenase [Hyphomicrobiales bacterium]|nr:quinoprotein ethanol dehydrogenase [Hyphomicrobiales bacterium]